MSATSGLPALTGSPLFIRTLPLLTAHRGKLLSSDTQRGTPVHAASFIRRREILLETELLTKPDLSLILVHEIFHFVWARLGNPKRAEYARLLNKEGPGELGESAAVSKETGRDYPCESFCDTAAWLYAPSPNRRHVTLAQRWQVRRRAWFEATFTGPLKC